MTGPDAAAPPPDDADRRRIETDLDTTMLVEASAGTGKTACLVKRMVALLAEGRCRPASLAAVTFTRKAAAELRARFQGRLESAAGAAAGERRERLAGALEHVEQCFIGTIHAFCGRLLRERPVEAGVDIGFEELDEDEEHRLRAVAWTEYADRLHAGDSPVLAELSALGLDLDRLCDTYLSFADYPDVPQWPAEEVTVDAAALDAARAALRDLVAHVATLPLPRPREGSNDELIPFYRQLPGRFRNCGHRDNELLDLLEDAASVRSFVLRDWPGGQPQGTVERARWVAFRDAHAVPLALRRRQARYSPVLRVLQEATGLYQDLRAERGALSFQDLLMKAAALLRGRPEVRRYFRRRFSHLLVDEFQDTDPVQAEVMLLLTAGDPVEADWRRCRPVPGSLFVVGDPKQSIYRFRRADIVTYNQVRRIIEGCGAQVILSANFRSIAPLIGAFNAASAELFPPAASDEAPADRPMHAGRRGASAAKCAGVAILEVPDKGAEAELVACSIRRALDERHLVPRSEAEVRAGRPPHVTPGDFMVVTHRREPLVELASALEALAVPVEVTGGAAVNEVREVQLLRAALAAIARPEDPVALVGALRSPLFGISDTELYRYRRARGRFSIAFAAQARDVPGAGPIADALELLDRGAAWLRRIQPAPAIERLSVELGLFASASAGPDAVARAGCLARGLELLRQVAGETWTVADLAAWLDELVFRDRTNERHDGLPARPHLEAVRVMNLHQVKGLEAPIVYLADGSGDMNEDVDLSIDRSREPVSGYLAVRGPRPKPWLDGRLLAVPAGWEQVEARERVFKRAENDRLLYVAATRAAAQLVICRPTYDRSKPRWKKLIAAMRPPPMIPAPAPPPDAAAAAGPAAPPVKEFLAELSQRLDDVTAPTHAVIALKSAVVHGGVRAAAAGGPGETGAAGGPEPDRLAGEHGTEWGEVIHAVLEAAATRPIEALAGIAAAALEDAGLDRALAPRVLEVAGGAVRSEIWRRASASEQRLVEVPIQTLEPAAPGGVPTIMRGVIDLVFREKRGWVIVDYKTDDTTRRAVDDLAAHYAPQVQAYAGAWSRLVGEPVVEAGILFVHDGRYRVVPLGDGADPTGQLELFLAQ